MVDNQFSIMIKPINLHSKDYNFNLIIIAYTLCIIINHSNIYIEDNYAEDLHCLVIPSVDECVNWIESNLCARVIAFILDLSAKES